MAHRPTDRWHLQALVVLCLAGETCLPFPKSKHRGKYLFPVFEPISSDPSSKRIRYLLLFDGQPVRRENWVGDGGVDTSGALKGLRRGGRLEPLFARPAVSFSLCFDIPYRRARPQRRHDAARGRQSRPAKESISNKHKLKEWREEHDTCGNLPVGLRIELWE
uniref:Uncharacterized protein n=1 Tax=Trichuris muris TaxID=70415 RepID=A0A5S6QE29_TRIMR